LVVKMSNSPTVAVSLCSRSVSLAACLRAGQAGAEPGGETVWAGLSGSQVVVRGRGAVATSSTPLYPELPYEATESKPVMPLGSCRPKEPCSKTPWPIRPSSPEADPVVGDAEGGQGVRFGEVIGTAVGPVAALPGAVLPVVGRRVAGAERER
jgi:hypothetical protein